MACYDPCRNCISCFVFSFVLYVSACLSACVAKVDWLGTWEWLEEDHHTPFISHWAISLGWQLTAKAAF